MKRDRKKELISLLFWLYVELMLLVVPKASGRWWCNLLAKLAALLVLLCVFALLVWGATLAGDYGDPIGYIPLAAAALISVAQIVAGILLYRKRRKGEIACEQDADA